MSKSNLSGIETTGTTVGEEEKEEEMKKADN